jgi:hypothetical protein
MMLPVQGNKAPAILSFAMSNWRPEVCLDGRESWEKTEDSEYPAQLLDEKFVVPSG